MKKADPYVDPVSGVLRNKLGLTAAAALNVHKRRFVSQRIVEGVPGGRFDLDHLRAIHRHLFQDVYDWAGEIRTVEMRGPRCFSPFGSLRLEWPTCTGGWWTSASYAASIARRSATRLASSSETSITSTRREGNGRTQLLYTQLLARQAGYRLDLTKLTGPTWIAACQEAHMGRYGDLAAALRGALSEEGA